MSNKIKEVEPRHFKEKKNITVCFRIPADLKDALDKIATNSGYTLANFVREGLDQWAWAHRDRLSNE